MHYFCSSMKSLFTLLAALVVIQAQSQTEKWDLKRCVEYATSHNISVKQADIQARIAGIQVKLSKLALYPSLFGEIRQPKTNYILIPRHSSENRKYIPFGYLSPDNIVGDTCLSVENVTLFHFGIIHSLMHFVWIKTTCGRIKSDFRYSNEIVYNNYPWPENPSEKQIKTIEEKAQNVLDVRASFPTSSLADLYNPLTMPPALVKAHNELDKAVDAAYSKQAFTSEAKRMEFLFELYEKYTAGLFVKEKKGKK